MTGRIRHQNYGYFQSRLLLLKPNRAQHLARHGVEVEIQAISSSQGGVAATIRQHVLDAEADLLVLGPYSRSRVVERVLGGVTEDLLAEVPAPLFVSH